MGNKKSIANKEAATLITARHSHARHASTGRTTARPAKGKEAQPQPPFRDPG
jgi:hypothetical protein